MPRREEGGEDHNDDSSDKSRRALRSYEAIRKNKHEVRHSPRTLDEKASSSQPFSGVRPLKRPSTSPTHPPRHLLTNRSSRPPPPHEDPSQAANPSPVGGSQRSCSPSSQASAPLFAYTLLLPHPHLVSFLIGPRGSRSQSIQHASNLASLTFRILATPSRPVAELKGSRNSIRRGVECIRRVLEVEMRLGMDMSLTGQMNRWCVVVDQDVTATGLTRNEWFSQKGGRQSVPSASGSKGGRSRGDSGLQPQTDQRAQSRERTTIAGPAAVVASPTKHLQDKGPLDNFPHQPR